VQEAKDLISLFQWDKYFVFRHIFPVQKTVHFQK